MHISFGLGSRWHHCNRFMTGQICPQLMWNCCERTICCLPNIVIILFARWPRCRYDPQDVTTSTVLSTVKIVQTLCESYAWDPYLAFPTDKNTWVFVHQMAPAYVTVFSNESCRWRHILWIHRTKLTRGLWNWCVRTKIGYSVYICSTNRWRHNRSGQLCPYALWNACVQSKYL